METASGQPGTANAISAVRLAGDRHADLVVGTLGRNYMTVLRGRGNGRFDSPRRYGLGGSAVDVGDVNDDRRPDVVTSDGSILCTD